MEKNIDARGTPLEGMGDISDNENTSRFAGATENPFNKIRSVNGGSINSTLDGFTGFNPELLQHSIEDFYDAGMILYHSLNNIEGNFYDVLKESWFSPKAVDFSKHFYDLNRAIYNLQCSYSRVAYKVIEAYNVHASANNLPTLSNQYEFLEYQPEGAEFGVRELLSQSADGLIGMNKSKVVQARDTFVQEMNKGIQEIFVTYQVSAFYDPSAVQNQAYLEMIQNTKDKLVTVFNDLLTDINKSIDEEVELNQSTVTKTVNTLNG